MVFSQAQMVEHSISFLGQTTNSSAHGENLWSHLAADNFGSFIKEFLESDLFGPSL
jgi:hypothetical protein